MRGDNVFPNDGVVGVGFFIPKGTYCRRGIEGGLTKASLDEIEIRVKAKAEKLEKCALVLRMRMNWVLARLRIEQNRRMFKRDK